MPELCLTKTGLSLPVGHFTAASALGGEFIPKSPVSRPALIRSAVAFRSGISVALHKGPGFPSVSL